MKTSKKTNGNNPTTPGRERKTHRAKDSNRHRPIWWKRYAERMAFSFLAVAVVLFACIELFSDQR